MTVVHAGQGLIDVHSHFVTEAYVAAGKAAGIEHPDGMPGWPTWRAEGQLDLMDRLGIETTVLSVSSPGVHLGDDARARVLARDMNREAAALCDRWPDRFRFLAALPLPDVDGSLAEAEEALAHPAAVGAVVETNARGRSVADPAFEPLWAALSVRESVVLVHPTSPPNAAQVTGGAPSPMLEFPFETTRAAASLVMRGVTTRHRGIRWVLTHCGGALPVLGDRIATFARAMLGDGGPDVDAELRSLWYDLAGTPFPRHADALVHAVGTARVVYGSDSCWTSDALIAAQVASLDAASAAGDIDWRALTRANAGRLLARR
ncbi:amidohydrolase family protein [Demequina sp. NBRC 110054]|uniref:amidohydrolase family protein n=1 Tax=Demequina sp. NBRC 110054 TaxID=1570343 RepID=UPI0009FE40A4|nr:amidohydrolase family protein [Demequina sp. NBRC 110054]